MFCLDFEMVPYMFNPLIILSLYVLPQSLRMLDNFLSRTLHHIMGPLHALKATTEIVSDRLQTQKFDETERRNSVELLERASETISGSARMIADVSDLARFGE